jgi:hypothetical protein
VANSDDANRTISERRKLFELTDNKQIKDHFQSEIRVTISKVMKIKEDLSRIFSYKNRKVKIFQLRNIYEINRKL